MNDSNTMSGAEIRESWEQSDRSQSWESYAREHATEIHRGRGTILCVFPDGGAYHFDGGNGQWYDATDEVLAWMSQS